MAPDSFERVLANAGPCSSHLHFHVLGEPLLHPALAQLLDIAHKHGKLVNLTTNGVLIGKFGPAILCKPALRQITFSLHSFTLGSDPAGVTRYLDPILEYARAAGPRHIVRLRVWNAIAGCADELREGMLRSIAEEFGISPLASAGLGSNSAVMLDKNIFLNPSLPFSWPDPSGPDKGERGFCLGLRRQIAILVDGTVVPCCLDRNGAIPLGNIFSQVLGDIVTSPRAQRLYDGFSRRTVVEPLCRSCSYRLRFDEMQPSGELED